jgi:TolB protein
MIDPPGDPDEDTGREAGFASEAEGESEPTSVEATGSARRRLRTAVALTLVAAIVIFGPLGGTRFGVTRDGGPGPSAAHPPRLAAIDANGALATMDGLGGSVVEYSAPGVAFQFPVWAPDGIHVAAIGTSIKGVGVYVLDATALLAPGGTAAPRGSTVVVDDSGVIYRGADRAPFYAYWSPDSRKLAFLTSESTGIALRAAPADGSSSATLIRQGNPLYWDWVDPGRLFAHVGGSGVDALVGEMGLDGKTDDATVIGHGSSVASASAPPGGSDAPDAAHVPGAFRSPAVSRDGHYRAYVERATDLGQRLVIEARDGSGIHALAAAGITAMAFDPSGRSLAYVTADAAASPFPIGPLRVVDTTSGSSRVLLGGKVVAFFWSPDGRTIATLAIPDSGKDGVQAGTTNAVPAMARFGPNDAADVAADVAAGVGLHLAFVDVATAAVRSERNVRVSDTFTGQVLPFFDQYALSHRFWSADSVSLALPLVGPTGTDQLVVLPADGGDPHEIQGRVIGFWSP